MRHHYSMVAKHVNSIQAEDKIFAASREAGNAAAKFGKEQVINATVGAILDDEEKLAIMPTVMEVLRNMPDAEYAAYAPIAGTPDFLEAAVTAAFKDCRPDGFIKAVATPGGSGALRHTIWNYSDIGDTILTSDWFWGPYKTLAEENLRKLSVFSYFDKDKKFNLASFEGKVTELLSRQDSLVILLNSPAHNPTGFALTDDEWQQLLEVLKQQAKDDTRKITLLCDIAYIDYAGEKGRSFMKHLSNLPENLLIVVAFSISKSLTMYGLRTGAAIGLSANKDVAQEFYDVCQASNRGTWSNGTRCGMRLLSAIMNDSEILQRVEQERKGLEQLLVERAAVFTEEADRIGLDICPYKAGFFVTVPVIQPDDACDRLKKDNVFAVPLSRGIRFAICSVPAAKLTGVAQKFKNAIG